MENFLFAVREQKMKLTESSLIHVKVICLLISDC